MEENILVNFNNYHHLKELINGMVKIINLYTMMNSEFKYKYIYIKFIFIVYTLLMAKIEQKSPLFINSLLLGLIIVGTFNTLVYKF